MAWSFTGTILISNSIVSAFFSNYPIASTVLWGNNFASRMILNVLAQQKWVVDGDEKNFVPRTHIVRKKTVLQKFEAVTEGLNTNSSFTPSVNGLKLSKRFTTRINVLFKICTANKVALGVVYTYTGK